MDNRPHCQVCNVPFLESEGKVLSIRNGKTYRCPTCFSSAITTQQEAEHLYWATAALLKRELALEMAVLPHLHIVNRATLMEKQRQAGALAGAATPSEPEPEHLQGFFHRVNDDWNIYIEHLLPRAQFQAVAAHELTHAWQSTHAAEKQAHKIIEGFAEWVAYQVLLILGEQREAARMTRRSDLYGEGLQYFLALERQKGRKGVMQRAVQL